MKDDLIMGKLGRFRLPQMRIKRDDHENLNYRVSSISSYFWCGWKAYLVAVKGMKISETEWMRLGTTRHLELFDSLGKRYPWEEKFLKDAGGFRLDEHGFVRKYEDDRGIRKVIYGDITGHPDDFQVTPDLMVSIMEYKVRRPMEDPKKKPSLWYINHFIIPVARFQAQIYAYITEPTAERLGYTVRDTQAVVVYSWDLKPIVWKPVWYNAVKTEEKIDEVLYKFAHPELIEPCKKWKCKYCDDNFKKKCPFWAKREKS